jgi:hypothetical protein
MNQPRSSNGSRSPERPSGRQDTAERDAVGHGQLPKPLQLLQHTGTVPPRPFHRPVKRLLEEMREAGTMRVGIWGGEPMTAGT